MPFIYSDPARQDDKYSLPNVEVFYCEEGDLPLDDLDDAPSGAGWYWWSCFPGCMPDSDPFGPFDTWQEAQDDARDSLED